MATPHDTLFRLAFGRPANARDLLRKALPRAIAEGIDWRSLRVIDATFIDRRLRKLQTDLLFSARLRGRRVLLYVLIEHKSRDDRWTVLQLFTYIGAIWRRYQRDHRREKRLPPILPFVLHHGDEAFTAPCNLRALLDLEGLPAALVAMQPEFTFALDDLASQSEEQLQARVGSCFAKLALLCLQRLRTGDARKVAATLRGWGQLMERLRVTGSGQDDLLAVFSYLFEVAGLPDEQLHTILTDITPRSTHKMITAAEHIRRRTRKEVMPKFMAAGQARLVLLLLQEKFGALPPKLVARIRRARMETLEGWFARALKANVLDNVFAES
ncbi:MAG TPA: Rpn family recombination-promoting nuclease/putative transposase [Planctomycetota bacterium]|nr:Rpn family recombination-promoting nuclease/putative transposase [Planctomycetota bacterium]